MTREPGALLTLFGHDGEPDGVYVVIDVWIPTYAPGDDAEAMSESHELYINFYDRTVDYA